ncbi:3-hydroxyacyl-CoA dehydrogenase NAD-binding domain-containing protein [Paraburkholderia elongata]|uniref:3-hydroxyacyl-CoA dehydrogenase n=1 Tax=Paraburkholderia elongata TaxID=2675747 RepID=A0A972NHN7_9BURK|nr:3-hydroxyacyl-CoA dehydrogenase NAD-binding domain-containing protein [Paraburkholderia elongata]NPT53191.1 3-hydroxyacyl-CoA dehydrogenase [Paraburkholderia elongata]
MIQTSLDPNTGIATLTWDVAGSPVNVKNRATIAAFVEAVDAVIADEKVTGIIVTSAKKDFISGGDLDELRAARTPEAALELVRGIGICLRRLETCGKPVVAAINGSAIGGGLEVALACHRRIAADNDATRIGLPEVTLGLMPGAGGTQRLPRLIGIKRAAPLLLDGKLLKVRDAAALGIIDDVVPGGELLNAAKAWLLEGPDATQPWDRDGYSVPGDDPQSMKGRLFFMAAWPKLRRKTSPDDPAAGAILQALHHGVERGIDAGLKIEARLFAGVACSSAARNKINTMFYGVNSARRLKARPAGVAPFQPKRLGVIGAGLMGSGIAHTAARAGLQVVILDVTQERADAGLASIKKNLAKALERGLITDEDAESIVARIESSSDFGLLAGVDAIVEAVVEREDIKADVTKRAMAAAPGALFASNTSTLPITTLAKLSPVPENFVGMHFFAPVDRMPLVEVIRGEPTSDEAVAKALDLCRILGKTPIVVRDGRGFYTSRVVGAYTREALLLLAEGVPPQVVDNVAINAGMPIGPLAMADQTSLDLLFDIIGSLAAEQRGQEPFVRALHVLDRLSSQLERRGRKANAGIYDYAPNGDKTAWSGLSKEFPAANPMPSEADIENRLLHIQALESIRAMEEGIFNDPVDADVASVLGWSFPSSRGGVLSHVDGVGIPAFVRQCEELQASYGDRFAPPRSLREMAEQGLSFRDLAGKSHG